MSSFQCNDIIIARLRAIVNNKLSFTIVLGDKIDNLQQALGDDEEEKRLAVCAYKALRHQHGTARQAQKKRKRKHPHPRPSLLHSRVRAWRYS